MISEGISTRLRSRLVHVSMGDASMARETINNSVSASDEGGTEYISSVIMTTETDERPQKRRRSYTTMGDEASCNGKTGALSSTLIKSLYSEAVAAKLWRIASRALGKVKYCLDLNSKMQAMLKKQILTVSQATPPTLFPEYTGKDGATYVYRDLTFWTSGFFPGSLYLLLERQVKYGVRPLASKEHVLPHPLQLQHLCQWWTVNLHQNATLKGTHDIGFMIAPWAVKAWELNRDTESLTSLVTAAYTLAARFDDKIQAIRSWDTCVTKRYSFLDPSKDFLVIIDNMLNLDLIFWVAKETRNDRLYQIALAHAKTTQRNHIRRDHTTFHVVNFDPQTGSPKARFTNQGYNDDSCWARGQAWGILGFMQSYHWTGDLSFLNTSQALADYFIANLPADGVPYWDFRAQLDSATPRDTSAAMIAACGMLLIYKALRERNMEKESRHYLNSALHIASSTVERFLNPPNLKFSVSPSQSAVDVYEEGDASDLRSKQEPGFLTVEEETPLQASNRNTERNGLPKAMETILNSATINNYEFAPRRWANHGLVYADYYFMLLGNMLLELDLVQPSLFSSA